MLLGVFVCHHNFFYWRVVVDYGTWLYQAKSPMKHKIITLLEKIVKRLYCWALILVACSILLLFRQVVLRVALL